MMIVSSITSTDRPPTTASSAARRDRAPADQWFDPKTAACVPEDRLRRGRGVRPADEHLHRPRRRPSTPSPRRPACRPAEPRCASPARASSRTPPSPSTASRRIDVNVVSDTTITAVTPASKNLYPVDIEVVNPGAEPAVLNNAFTYVTPAVPLATEVNPARGSTQGGEAVIIKGTGFVDGTRVAFGGRSATEVTVLNPTHAAGHHPGRLRRQDDGQRAQARRGRLRPRGRLHLRRSGAAHDRDRAARSRAPSAAARRSPSPEPRSTPQADVLVGGSGRAQGEGRQQHPHHRGDPAGDRRSGRRRRAQPRPAGGDPGRRLRVRRGADPRRRWPRRRAPRPAARR